MPMYLQLRGLKKVLHQMNQTLPQVCNIIVLLFMLYLVCHLLETRDHCYYVNSWSHAFSVYMSVSPGQADCFVSFAITRICLYLVRRNLIVFEIENWLLEYWRQHKKLSFQWPWIVNLVSQCYWWAATDSKTTDSSFSKTTLNIIVIIIIFVLLLYLSQFILRANQGKLRIICY